MARKKEDKKNISETEEITKLEEQKIEKEEELTVKEITDIQNEINKELLKVKKTKEKKKSQNATYLFFTFFVKRLREDKLYLFSFLVTITFFSIFSFKKLQETEGYYDRKQENKLTENNTTPTVNTPTENKKNETTITDELDISDYIGIYSREIVLTSPVVLNNTCTITDYKIIYQIKKDKTMTKYLMNDCLGTIKMWSDSLKYVSSSGARYISANNVNFLFSTTNMKEVDGETYKIDEEISTIRENRRQKDIENYFYDNNIILMSKDDLVLLKGSNISYQLSEKYKINKVIDQIVYKSSAKNQFNFIIFIDSENKTCYSEEEINKEGFEDTENYKIYTIKYDAESGTFAPEKEIISRNKSASCTNYEEDLEELKN